MEISEPRWFFLNPNSPHLAERGEGGSGDTPLRSQGSFGKQLEGNPKRADVVTSPGANTLEITTHHFASSDLL